MNENINSLRKIFERLPLAERNMPAFIINEKTLTWEEAWIEVRDNKSLSNNILTQLEQFKNEK